MTSPELLSLEQYFHFHGYDSNCDAPFISCLTSDTNISQRNPGKENWNVNTKRPENDDINKQHRIQLRPNEKARFDACREGKTRQKIYFFPDLNDH